MSPSSVQSWSVQNCFITLSVCLFVCVFVGHFHLNKLDYGLGKHSVSHPCQWQSKCLLVVSRVLSLLSSEYLKMRNILVKFYAHRSLCPNKYLTNVNYCSLSCLFKAVHKIAHVKAMLFNVVYSKQFRCMPCKLPPNKSVLKRQTNQFLKNNIGSAER